MAFTNLIMIQTPWDRVVGSTRNGASQNRTTGWATTNEEINNLWYENCRRMILFSTLVLHTTVDQYDSEIRDGHVDVFGFACHHIIDVKPKEKQAAEFFRFLFLTQLPTQGAKMSVYLHPTDGRYKHREFSRADEEPVKAPSRS